MKLFGVAAAWCGLVMQSMVIAHSWLECTNYHMTAGSANSEVWDSSICTGHARCGQRQSAAGFGVDTGLNYHSKDGCQCQRAPDNYDGNSTKIAVYTPGQRVCLAYPPKNHVAAPCTNAYIPDAGVTIHRTALNPTTDNEFNKEYQHLNGIHQSGQIDYKGFQNCPKFCDDMQHALCTMCFDLEPDIAPGDYSFKWIWSFNGPDDSYSTCWEGRVEAGGDQNQSSQESSAVPSTPTQSSSMTPSETSTDYSSGSEECENGPDVPVNYPTPAPSEATPSVPPMQSTSSY